MLIEKCVPRIDLTKDCSCNLNKKPATMMEGFDEIVNEMRQLFLIKQREYEKENVLEFGALGLIMRLREKSARIKKIIQRGNENDLTGESLDEIIKDSGNYSIMLDMFLRGYWDLPLEQENK